MGIVTDPIAARPLQSEKEFLCMCLIFPFLQFSLVEHARHLWLLLKEWQDSSGILQRATI